MQFIWLLPLSVTKKLLHADRGQGKKVSKGWIFPNVIFKREIQGLQENELEKQSAKCSEGQLHLNFPQQGKGTFHFHIVLKTEGYRIKWFSPHRPTVTVRLLLRGKLGLHMVAIQSKAWAVLYRLTCYYGECDIDVWSWTGLCQLQCISALLSLNHPFFLLLEVFIDDSEPSWKVTEKSESLCVFMDTGPI